MKFIYCLTLVLMCFTVLAQQPSSFYFDKKSQQYFINDKASFSIRPTDNFKYLDRIEVSIDDGKFAPYSGSIKFQKDGAHVIRFKAVDPVLNWSPTQSFRVFVDTSQPESFANWSGDTYTKDGKLYINSNTSMLLSAQDDMSGISKIVWKEEQGKDYIPYKREIKFKKEGPHSIQITSIDNVGNMGVAKNYSFIVDKQPPVSKMSYKGNTYSKGDQLYISKGGNILLSGFDDKSGIKEIEYYFYDNNGVKSKIYKFNQKISISEKTTRIRYRSLDNVGNREKWKELSVNLDTLPPDIYVKKKGNYVLSSGKIYALPGLSLLAKINDNGSGSKEILVDSGKNLEEQGAKNNRTKKFVFKNEGQFELSFSAIDNVGNLANTKSFQVVIDKISPKTTFSSNVQLVKKGKILLTALPNSIDFSAKDLGVGVKHIEISYDGKNYNKLKGPIDLATWRQTQRTIYYRSIDQLGNREVPKEITINVRKRGPKIGLFIESNDIPNIPLSKLMNKYNKKKRIPASSRRDEAPLKKEPDEDKPKEEVKKEELSVIETE